MSKKFAGMIAGIKYDHPAAFEKAARDAGWRHSKGRTRDWRAGLPVRIKLQDGTYVEGQVWAKAPREGYVWAALDSGKFVLIDAGLGVVYGAKDLTSSIGKVAA